MLKHSPKHVAVAFLWCHTCVGVTVLTAPVHAHVAGQRVMSASWTPLTHTGCMCPLCAAIGTSMLPCAPLSWPWCIKHEAGLHATSCRHAIECGSFSSCPCNDSSRNVPTPMNILRVFPSRLSPPRTSSLPHCYCAMTAHVHAMPPVPHVQASAGPAAGRPATRAAVVRCVAFLTHTGDRGAGVCTGGAPRDLPRAVVHVQNCEVNWPAVWA